MWHLCQITEYDLPINILAENDRNPMFCMDKLVRFENFTQRDFDFPGICYLYADRIFPGYRGEDIDPFGSCCAGQIAFEAGDFVDPDPAGRVDLKSGNRRTPCNIARA